MYSTEGGVNIEDVAHDTPEKIFKEWVHPGGGLPSFQARKIGFNLGLKGDAFKNCIKFVTNLYNAYVGLDCSMLEINPLFKTSDNKIIAVDCKMNIDDNALMRHPDVAVLRDISEEDTTEVEAAKFNLNFVKLDGNVGCMVNGAGLAMATMDMIKLSGNSFRCYTSIFIAAIFERPFCRSKPAGRSKLGRVRKLYWYCIFYSSIIRFNNVFQKAEF